MAASREARAAAREARTSRDSIRYWAGAVGAAAMVAGIVSVVVMVQMQKPTKPKTVAWLVGLTRPKPAPKTRSTFERHIYSVEAAVTDVLQEADKDLHVVLEDGPAHMVAESPNAPFCSVDATA